MFTGLVQGLAKISSIQKLNGDCRFVFEPSFVLNNVQIGESIAVNGTCLTVEQYLQSRLVMFASKESLERTNLQYLQEKSLVNLERALRIGDSLGGHFVSGHVDCLALVNEIHEVGRSKFVRLSFPEEFAIYIVDKGSVCLDGISLTVNRCIDNFFEVNIIPETWQGTTIQNWNIGSKVNLEVDVLAKYVQKLMHKSDHKKELSIETLAKYGFIG